MTQKISNPRGTADILPIQAPAWEFLEITARRLFKVYGYREIRTPFFEESGLYAKSSTTFDGAIAVSPAVVSDLLSITGPIAIGKPTTTFTADNFLVQIQKIVQDGQATSATYPKQVISDLSKAIFSSLASGTSTDRGALLAAMLDWVAKKEVMAYFKDPAMEDFLDAYDASGAVYALPQRFNGDYLAVVDTNVNGGN